MSTTGRRVAIVGKSPITCEMANKEPLDVEIWGLNDSYLFLKRWNRWFEMHKKADDGTYGYGRREYEHFDFLWNCEIPVYQNQVDERIPTSVVFPFHEVGSRYRHYWTSSIAYMLSLAVYEHVAEIHLWGVDMASASEYADQRPCCEYWIGRAEAQGIKVVIPDSSPLLKTPAGSYGLYVNGSFNATALRDEILRIDARVRTQEAALDGHAPVGAMKEALAGQVAVRQKLVQMLGELDPSSRGRPVEGVIVGVVEDSLGSVEVLAPR